MTIISETYIEVNNVHYVKTTYHTLIFALLYFMLNGTMINLKHVECLRLDS